MGWFKSLYLIEVRIEKNGRVMHGKLNIEKGNWVSWGEVSETLKKQLEADLVRIEEVKKLD